MIKISNIKSTFTWDTNKKKVICIDNKNIYLKDKKIFKITSQNLPFDKEFM